MWTRLLLALWGFTSLTSAAVRKRQTVSSSPPSGWTYQGCYSDSVSNRVLSASSYSSNNAMTEESCIAFCSKGGYTFAGMEYAGECYCDYQLASSSVKEPETDCNMACSGNSAELCGAGNRLTVFSTTRSGGPSTNPGPSGWTSVGCYTDSTSARTLQNGEAVPAGPSGMTVAQCTATCKQYGFKYAGLEYSQECYCDNVIRNNAVLATSGCNMLCSGNSSEYCGGANRLNLYITSTSGSSSSSGTLPTGWSSLGCFSDNVSARTLSSGQAVPGGYTNMTIEGCLGVCQNAGYTLAGLEYSQECYCDNQLRNGGACTSDQTICNMPCKGNSAETCGGPNGLNLYQYGSAGAVSSCPASQTLASSTSTSVIASSTSSTITTSTVVVTPTSTSQSSSIVITTSSVQNSTSPTSTPTTTARVNSTSTLAATTTLQNSSSIVTSTNSSTAPSTTSLTTLTSSKSSSTTSSIATTTSAACAVATTAFSSGVLSNGDFENGSSPWKITISPGNATITSLTNGSSYSNCGAVEIIPTTTDQTVIYFQQTYSGLTVGQTYTVTINFGLFGTANSLNGVLLDLVADGKRQSIPDQSVCVPASQAGSNAIACNVARNGGTYWGTYSLPITVTMTSANFFFSFNFPSGTSSGNMLLVDAVSFK